MPKTPGKKSPHTAKASKPASYKRTKDKFTAENVVNTCVEIIAHTKKLHTTEAAVRKSLNSTPQVAFGADLDEWHKVTHKIGARFDVTLSECPTDPGDSIQDFIYLILFNLKQSRRLLSKTSVFEKAAQTDGAAIK
jgi:hypothetical protein